MSKNEAAKANKINETTLMIGVCRETIAAYRNGDEFTLQMFEECDYTVEFFLGRIAELTAQLAELKG